MRRRRFVASLVASVASAPMIAAADTGAAQGQLRARPDPARTGEQPLGLGERRDGLLYVPPGGRVDRARPLLVMLHGAGGVAGQVLSPVAPYADARDLVVLAPDSRGRTWDVILGGYGPDIAFLDRALQKVFVEHAIDPRRIAIGGFSDGASYAVSPGLTNGALFTHVLAFSPGFAAPAETPDSPRFFVSHGTDDDVLPIDRCSRRLVPALRRAGYDVDYREFDGGHVVPPPMIEAALAWFLR